MSLSKNKKLIFYITQKTVMMIAYSLLEPLEPKVAYYACRANKKYKAKNPSKIPIRDSTEYRITVDFESKQSIREALWCVMNLTGKKHVIFNNINVHNPWMCVLHAMITGKYGIAVGDFASFDLSIENIEFIASLYTTPKYRYEYITGLSNVMFPGLLKNNLEAFKPIIDRLFTRSCLAMDFHPKISLIERLYLLFCATKNFYEIFEYNEKLYKDHCTEIQIENGYQCDVLIRTFKDFKEFHGTLLNIWFELRDDADGRLDYLLDYMEEHNHKLLITVTWTVDGYAKYLWNCGGKVRPIVSKQMATDALNAKRRVQEILITKWIASAFPEPPNTILYKIMMQPEKLYFNYSGNAPYKQFRHELCEYTTIFINNFKTMYDTITKNPHYTEINRALIKHGSPVKTKITKKETAYVENIAAVIVQLYRRSFVE